MYRIAALPSWHGFCYEKQGYRYGRIHAVSHGSLGERSHPPRSPARAPPCCSQNCISAWPMGLTQTAGRGQTTAQSSVLDGGTEHAVRRIDLNLRSCTGWCGVQLSLHTQTRRRNTPLRPLRELHTSDTT